MQRRLTQRPKALWVQIKGAPEKRPKKRIKAVSKGRAKELRLYSKLRQIQLLEVSTCEVCHSRAASDVHHKRGRVGDLLNDRSHWMSVCRICHDLIHKCPKWAAEKNYIEPKAWNQSKPRSSRNSQQKA